MVMTKQKLQKINNQLFLLRLIRSSQNISQAELSIKTKLQPSTVSNLVREFKQKGMVHISGKGESGELGGKKSSLLSFNSKHGIFSGISIKKEAVIFSLFDFTGKILNQTVKNISNFSTKDLINLITSEINDKYQKYPNYKGVGIAVSSVVNANGNITYSFGNILKISHFQIDIKNEIPPIPFIVENDANCAAYYSNLFLKEKYKNLITYSIYFNPFCIGAGIILNNQLYKGSSNAAGEIWESISELHEDLNEISLDEINQLDKIANNNDVKKFIAKLRSYILTTAMFIDTDAIVLNGDITYLNKNLLTEFIASLKTTYNNFVVEIINGNDLAVAGAAMLALDLYINTKLKGGAY